MITADSKLPYRPWWPVWMLASIGASLTGIAVGSTLVISNQRAEEADDRAERAERRAAIAEERAAESQERLDCRALFAVEVDEADLHADQTEHRLVSLVARQIIATTPPVRQDFLNAIDELDEATAVVADSLAARQTWLMDGSPLPCPIEVEP